MSGPVQPIKNPYTYTGRIIWIHGKPYPDPGGERYVRPVLKKQPKGTW